MKYETHDSIKFYIPDTWLAESGFTEITLAGDCCFASEDAGQVLDIQQISSPVRSPGVRREIVSPRIDASDSDRIRLPPESTSN